MIPKTIHYCWFGRGPKPDLAKKCIHSWKRHCKGYRIIEWNEDNFDISTAPVYVQQAYEAKKWAFVTDYVRLKVVYDHGGIYMDTDVELKKNLTPLLSHSAYFGFENKEYINTGLGFGAHKNSPILAELMLDYYDIPFLLEDKSFDLTPCPVRNTKVFLRNGLIQEDRCQILPGDILVLSSVYLCPCNPDMTFKEDSHLSYSIHWFSGSWFPEDKREHFKKWIEALRKDYLLHTPNRIFIRILGRERYDKIRCLLKGNRSQE